MEQKVERATRGGWRWWWIWPVIIALAVWWAGWGWGGTGGWWWGRTAHQNTAIPAKPGSTTTETLANAGAKQPQTSASAAAGGPEEPVTGPGTQILQAQDKRPYIGRNFEANDVPVQQKVNDRAIWIGASATANNGTMLAILSPRTNRNANGIARGQMVDAQGTVEKAPPADRARHDWGLSNQDALRLEHEGAYIQVSELTTPQK